MTLLVIGLLLFMGVHFTPSLLPELKSSWRGEMGEGGYKGSFSSLLLASFGLTIIGWRSVDPTSVYMPSPALRQPAIALVAVAFILLIVGSLNGR